MAVNHKLQKFMHGLSILVLYTEVSIHSQFCYTIVEQALCYYHSKFQSDIVFLRKDIAPNKYNIWITLRVRFSETPANTTLNIFISSYSV